MRLVLLRLGPLSWRHEIVDRDEYRVAPCAQPRATSFLPPPLGGDGGWRLTAQFAPHSLVVVSCMERARARRRFLSPPPRRSRYRLVLATPEAQPKRKRGRRRPRPRRNRLGQRGASAGLSARGGTASPGSVGRVGPTRLAEERCRVPSWRGYAPWSRCTGRGVRRATGR